MDTDHSMADTEPGEGQGPQGGDTPEQISLRLGPELTIAQASAVRETVLAQLALIYADPNATTLTLDLADVSEFDSAGLQLLLATHRSLTDAGRRLVMASPSRPVREAVATLGAQALFGEAWPEAASSP